MGADGIIPPYGLASASNKTLKQVARVTGKTEF
jgi:hypothetical protein